MKKYINPRFTDPQNTKNSSSICLPDLHNWNDADSHRLVKAIMICSKTPDLLRLFLDDLLTKNEIELCVKRLLAADFIAMGAPYINTYHMTGLSSATISKIMKKIKNKKGGYNASFSRMYLHGIRLQ